jgi:hypothetical protein
MKDYDTPRRVPMSQTPAIEVRGLEKRCAAVSEQLTRTSRRS